MTPPTEGGDKVVRLRYRLGVRLLRPYLDEGYRHYTKVAADATTPDEQRQNCTYIAIGLGYALSAARREWPWRHHPTEAVE